MSGPAIRLVVLSGSLREGSFNTSLARFVAKNMVAAGGVEVDEISLRELDLPLFSEDIAEVLHPNVTDFKHRLLACDAMLIASPEYNGSFTGALKNAIDWGSTEVEGKGPLACYKGKVGGLLAASTGAIGGLRGIRHVRQVLTQLHMLVVPTEFALGAAHTAFDDAGNLKDEQAAFLANQVGQAVVDTARKMK